jgi:hypothetical protein
MRDAQTDNKRVDMQTKQANNRVDMQTNQAVLSLYLGQVSCAPMQTDYEVDKNEVKGVWSEVGYVDEC